MWNHIPALKTFSLIIIAIINQEENNLVCVYYYCITTCMWYIKYDMGSKRRETFRAGLKIMRKYSFAKTLLASLLQQPCGHSDCSKNNVVAGSVLPASSACSQDPIRR